MRAAAERAGWPVIGLSLEATSGLALTALVLDRRVGTVLAGASDPPPSDERSRIPELVALVDALARRRPELTTILAGPLADHPPGPDDGGARPERIYAPAATPVDPTGGALGALLLRLRAAPDDARQGIARAAASLAFVLDRRVETIEIGFDAGLRCVAWPDPAAEGGAGAIAAIVPGAGLVPEEPSDALVDGILAWSVVAIDRHRIHDRLRELRLTPWSDAHGEGALLRLAAARAAVGRLVAATPDLDAFGAPDLVVATGGAWAVAPGPAAALALADVLRRPGASSVAHDHARILGPLGAIPNEAERRTLLADLADDLLAPLGSIVVPGGVHAGRSAGRVVVHGGSGSSELELVPGGLQLVDLPPGQLATAEFRFRDPVLLGTRGRRFSIEVAGGLGGLLIDLRDVPLRLPERSERRRELLAAWQAALWTGMDG
jgi:hypothetical protein